MPRIFEIFIVLVSLVIGVPILVGVSLVVLLSVGPPVLFRQERGGLGGTTFLIVKFRTMLNRTDRNGTQLPDSERLTRAGRFLRATSLDELPELWNVLKGEMALVGPRPLHADYLSLYSEKQRQRLHVKPGITGWAQINGRNSLTWEQRFEMDLWYIQNKSLTLDIYILMLTAVRVICRTDINANDSIPMPRFTGSNTN